MLIQLINENGGMAIIPEAHVNLILRSCQAHIRPIVDPVPMRTVSLVFRKDYIHEQLLNVVVDAVKTIIPSGMQEQVIKGERIKL
jgi:DNA-binding transcriptional LysR family regulator